MQVCRIYIIASRVSGYVRFGTALFLVLKSFERDVTATVVVLYGFDWWVYLCARYWLCNFQLGHFTIVVCEKGYHLTEFWCGNAIYEDGWALPCICFLSWENRPARLSLIQLLCWDQHSCFNWFDLNSWVALRILIHLRNWLQSITTVKSKILVLIFSV